MDKAVPRVLDARKCHERCIFIQKRYAKCATLARSPSVVMNSFTDQPSPGDVVVMPDTTSPSSYIIATVPHPGQLRYPTAGEAIAVAKRWARENSVTAWHTHDGLAFTRISLNGQEGG